MTTTTLKPGPVLYRGRPCELVEIRGTVGKFRARRGMLRYTEWVGSLAHAEPYRSDPIDRCQARSYARCGCCGRERVDLDAQCQCGAFTER